jgi:hypothetical protein
MTGTEDYSPIGETKPEQRRVPFDHISAADQYLLTFKGGDHMVFSGRSLLTPNSQDQAFQDLILQSSTAFWDAYLKGDSKAKGWLRGDGFSTMLGARGVFEKKPVKSS